jgi:aryl-alcohol dehydrogenase-like predicted oxidoreductase
MEKRAFGKLGEVSCLTLGRSGIGQLWGPTSRDEAVATVSEAAEAAITFLDVALAKCTLGSPPRVLIFDD